MAKKEAEVDNLGWEVIAQEEGEPWKPTREGEILIGVYQGFTTATDPAGLDGNPRDFNIYRILTEEGLRVVYSTYKLDGAFKHVSEGDEVSLTFVGKIPIGNGQTMNDFKVLKRAH